MIRPITVILGFITLGLTPVAVSGPEEDLVSQAQTAIPDLRHGMVLYLQHCAACHGRRAWGDGPQEIPALAGQRESYLLEQLVRFVSGARRRCEMHGPAMHERLQPSDVDRPQAFRDLATYLAQAPHNPEPEHGEGLGVASQRVASRPWNSLSSRIVRHLVRRRSQSANCDPSSSNSYL
jgi:mono/diheme cytochrome c family protein